MRKAFPFLLFLLVVGCTGNGDRVLRFFFDGVDPPPESAAVIALKVRKPSEKSQQQTAKLVVHQPYAEDACGKCHDLSQRGMMKAEMPQLCFNCHEDEAFTKAEVHSPVEDGECIACHHPHESQEESLLRKPIPQPCWGCHEAEEFEAENVHSPVEDGECIACHNPHSSELSALLQAELPKPCFECHEAEEFEGENVHSPVEDGECIACHNPHASKLDALLQAELPKPCFECHEAAEFEGENVHSPVEDGECAECHSPHAAEEEFLLRKPVIETCLGCHEREDIEGAHEKPVLEEQGSCIECHNPHVAEGEFLLREKKASRRERGATEPEHRARNSVPPPPTKPVPHPARGARLTLLETARAKPVHRRPTLFTHSPHSPRAEPWQPAGRLPRSISLDSLFPDKRRTAPAAPR